MSAQTERHNGSHQSIRPDAPTLYGDHDADECADRASWFAGDYRPGSGPRADDDGDDE